MKDKTILIKRILPLLFYTVFFLSLFSQFPINKSIPGNCDSWLVISLSNTYIENIRSYLTDEPCGRAMYPANNVHAYGESATGSAIIFIIYKLFGLNDYLAYYLYISTIFILTAFGIFLLATLYSESALAALFSGFAFTCSNLLFAHIDDSIVFFFFLPALVFYYMIRYFRDDNPKYLFISAILGGLQIYFSVYVFIYQSLALLIIFVFHIFRKPGNIVKKHLLLYPAAASVYALIALPNFLFYLNVLNNINFVEPFVVSKVIKYNGLAPADMLRILPGNLIYGGKEPVLGADTYWTLIRKYSFTGILLMLLALCSPFRKGVKKGHIIFIGLMGLSLSFSMSFQIIGTEFHGLSYYLYRWFPLLTFLRLPMRAYFLFSFAVSILACIGLDFIIRVCRCTEGKRAFLFMIPFFLIHFLENTPFPMKRYSVHEYTALSEDYAGFAKDKKNELFLDLPSSLPMRYVNWDDKLFSNPFRFIYRKAEQPVLRVKNGEWIFRYSHLDLYEYNREIIYMNWQTKHRQNIVGGINGYFPAPRVIFQKMIDELPKKKSLLWLKKQGVTYIIFHKNMRIPEPVEYAFKSNEYINEQPGKEELLYYLESSKWLTMVYEGQDISVFRFSGSLTEDSTAEE